ncbi:hypothetical protein WJX72_004501 [[Myrmecia] bisecta]|uniref:Aminotransferase class I/classII large domain-containing protein n=1 Tax=[Myrmecia] bisecta TaxID=41462 RepID=A0AAW1QQC6_9CHLO
MALLNEGDEAIFFEPLYDAYLPLCQRCGGVVKTVKLNPHDWSVPREELAAAFSPKTKLILVNSPHNPTGKVFSDADLDFIAELCRQHNVYAVLDEVYEHLVFPGHRHVSLRTLPGMSERSVRIGSAGKTFSFTAWKVGWVTGPSHLVTAITKAHSFMIFTVPSNLQRAVAHGLDHEQNFFLSMGAALQRKRDYLADRLSAIGFRILPAQGTYFLVADFSPLLPEGSVEGDVDFCHRLTVDGGVTVLPVSAFYSGQGAPRTLVRFCFCKDDAKLVKACDLLEQYFKR